jgi:hypothetical protein
MRWRRVADVFAQMNNKMGGDMKKIQTTGRYFVEIWKAIGMEGIGDTARPRLPKPLTIHAACTHAHKQPCQKLS